MKKILVLLSVFLMVAYVAAPALAQNRPQAMKGAGVGYADSLRFSNGHGLGTGGWKDTLHVTLKGGLRDTSSSFDLQNIRNLGTMWKIDNRQGATGGIDTFTFSCSLDVSVDGKNWDVVANFPVFTTALTVDIAPALYSYYAEGLQDSIGRTLSNDIFGQAAIQCARWGRFRTVSTLDTADTLIVEGQMYSDYKPLR
jgi:hypothetical protein